MLTGPLLIGVLLLAIAILLVSIIKFRLNAFIALLITSLVTSILVGMPIGDIASTISGGFGSTLSGIGIVTGLGVMLGKFMFECGAIETISNAKYYQSALILQEKYKNKSKSDYAKSFETKKNIPQKQLQVMRNTTFLKNFSFVEIDELVDIKKFNLIQKEFFILNESLKLSKYLKNKPELRFRRLGKLKVEGVYYPFKKCICIDINNST